MDYVVGSVAALVSGNVTPNRPRILKRALTPTKHQPSPNVTPKSEFVDDRSIFLSPTLQKKKAIVKKSPKRIFQNPDLDVTNEGEGNSEKADKVRKHLKEELDDNKMVIKSPAKQRDIIAVKTEPIQCKSPKKKAKNIKAVLDVTEDTGKSPDEQENKESVTEVSSNIETVVMDSAQTTPKKKKKKNRKKNKNATSSQPVDVTEDTEKSPDEQDGPQISKKKRKLSESVNQEPNFIKIGGKPVKAHNNEPQSKKKNKRKKKSKVSHIVETDKEIEIQNQELTDGSKPKKRKNNKNVVNLNAITNENTDSEHESDDEISSETEKANNYIINTFFSVEDSSEDEDKEENITKQNNESQSKKKNKLKKKSKVSHIVETDKQIEIQNQELTDGTKTKERKRNKHIVNPNAITNEDTDSEHESDDEINSETEEVNNEIFNNGSVDESSDEEDEEENETNTVKKKEGAKKTERTEINIQEELKRTLFVGNVTYTPKCKKDLKKIFMHYGAIQTIRFRTIPIKDARLTPKVAVIKNELHPERSTVNAYIKYKDAESVDKALVENNTLFKDKHLRVTRSESTGDTYDPKLSVFVGNLPFALEDEALREKFENCGEIESVRIVRDKKTNIGKGFGYVNFKSKDGVELALQLTDEDLTIKNRILRVKRCTHTNKPLDNPPNQSMNSQSDFNNRGSDFNNRGRDFNNRGRDFNNRGRDFNNKGRDFNNRGRDFNNRGSDFSSRGRDFNNRGRGLSRGGQRSFRGNGDFNSRGSSRGRGGQRGFRGGSNFSGRGGQISFNDRNQDGQTQGYQRGRSHKDDIGAFRRIQNKRPNQDGGNEGPPNKRPKDSNQPAKEKKARKEFVGMTAEKKKKRKNSKSQGLRQKKALSEILTK